MSVRWFGLGGLMGTVATGVEYARCSLATGMVAGMSPDTAGGACKWSFWWGSERRYVTPCLNSFARKL